MTAKPRRSPHVFVADPDLPPDHTGRGICTACHLVGRRGDAHHTMPDPPDDVQRLAAGERRDA